ncbi:MAG: hypothetical protein JSW33_16860 [bacterium]|nr:MAG: hypothetical protein JSW33_16860 [bacterium]
MFTNISHVLRNRVASSHAFLRPWFTFILLSSGLLYPSFTQNSDLKTAYESRKVQLDFLIETVQLTDSLIYYYVNEAEYFARQEEYQIATDLLNEAIDFLSMKPDTADVSELDFLDLITPWAKNLSISDQPRNPWQFTAEMGTDFSRNEYELSFLESDSLILEQLNNPFLAMRISKSYSRAQNWLNFYNFTRIDQDLLQTSFYLAMESMEYKKNWRIEGRTDWFWLLQENSGTFWENELRLYWNYLLTSRNRLYLQSNLRSKIYFPSNETFRNIYDGELYIAIRHHFRTLHWLELSVRPRRYLENQSEGSHYTQLNAQFAYNNRLDYNRYLIGRFNYYLRDFRNSFYTDNYTNQYQSLRPSLEAEWPVIEPFGLEGRFELDKRSYQNPDLTYSDYLYTYFNLQLKYYFNVYTAFGIGYLLETEDHLPDDSSESPVINLEDSRSRGISVSMDILQMKGLMISLNYGYLLRTFPNAGTEDILGIYSNRRIHSLQLFGFCPLNRHRQFQFYANYDNDQDRDHDNNDNLNTLFNISLLYQF